MSWTGDAFGDSGSQSDGNGPMFVLGRDGVCREVYSGELAGDLINTPDEARAARSAVGTLEKVFAAAGSPAAYKPYVEAIVADWKAYDDALVFYTWAQAKAIGQRAQALTAQIAAAHGLAQPIPDPALQAGPTSQALDLAATLVKGLLIAGAVAGAGYVWRTFTTRRTP